MKETVGLI